MYRVVTLLVLCVVGSGSSASADGLYFTESVGGTQIKDELGEYIDGGLRLRLSLGWRHRRWAVEGWVAGDIAAQGSHVDDPAGRPYDTAYRPAPTLMTYGLDLKHIRPISDHVEVYLRGSVSRGRTQGVLDGYSGRGLGFGAGVQLEGKVRALGFLAWPLFFTGWGPKVTAAVFVDNGYDFYRLHREGKLSATPAVDAQLTHLTIGFGVGSDF